MSPKRKVGLHFFPDQSFSCINCGKCCRIWDVPVTSSEMEKLLKLGISGMELLVSECFVKDARHRNLFIIRKNDLKCVFLDENNFCRIHSGFGEKAKPLACRIYPFDVFNWKDSSISASFRFDCPAVVSGKGKKISSYGSEILGFSSELGKSGKFSDAIYSREVSCDIRRLRIIADSYKNILLCGDFKPGIRILAASQMIDFHSRSENRSDIAGAEDFFREDSMDIVRRSAAELRSQLENPPALNVRQRILFRYIINGFIRTDEMAKYGNSVIGRLKRTNSLLQFCLGRGRLSDFLQEYEGDASSDPLRHIGGSLVPDDALSQYWKYVGSKLSSMHFCGYPVFGYTFEEGILHLLMTYPAITSIASMISIAANRDGTISSDDICKAIMIVDHTFSRSPFFRLSRTRKIIRELCSPKVLPALV